VVINQLTIKLLTVLTAMLLMMLLAVAWYMMSEVEEIPLSFDELFE